MGALVTLLYLLASERNAATLAAIALVAVAFLLAHHRAAHAIGRLHRCIAHKKRIFVMVRTLPGLLRILNAFAGIQWIAIFVLTGSMMLGVS